MSEAYDKTMRFGTDDLEPTNCKRFANGSADKYSKGGSDTASSSVF